MLQQVLAKLRQAAAEHAHAKRRCQEEKAALTIGRQKAADAEAAQLLLQGVAAAVQHHAHAKIAGVVSHCLRAVFGDEAYQLQITFERKRGKTEAVLAFVRGGLVLEDPLHEAGGGQVDVAALALRLVCLALTGHRRLLVLDEPLKNVSPHYQHLVPPLLEELAEQLQVQIIFTTNIPALRAGHVIDLGDLA